MARMSASTIYQVALQAGFPPDEAVTFTAIALAESRGDPRANAAGAEDSRGLWQINVDAHGGRFGDLYDPLTNARAALEVSDGGRNLRPWSVTHERHRGTAQDYRTYLDEAQAAAGAGAHRASASAAGTGDAGHAATEVFVRAALAQTGDEYEFGATDTTGRTDPTEFDCSELVKWAAGQAGVTVSDGSWLQYQQLQQKGGAISVQEALHTRGALLFSFSEPPTGEARPAEAHVAISLGDGRTIEARGEQYGVGSWSAGNRFNYAAVIPGLSTATPPSPFDMPVALPPPTDTDQDGVTDEFEALLGTDPTKADSDDDQLTDLFETSQSHTDPVNADTDADRSPDNVEVAEGADAGRVELPTAAIERGYGGADTVDTDDDDLSDLFELRIGSNRLVADSDNDGLLDGHEHALGGDLTTIDTDRDGITDAAEAHAGTLGLRLAVPGAAGPLPPPSAPAAPDPQLGPGASGADDLSNLT